MSGMDYGQFEQLLKAHKDLAKDYDKFLDTFLTREGMRCLRDTKRNTPKVTGRLINAWKVSGPFKRNDNKYVVIHNNVEYASFVEDGHRLVRGGRTIKWVPGKHMAYLALLKTESNLDKRFEKAFADFCRGKGLG